MDGMHDPGIAGASIGRRRYRIRTTGLGRWTRVHGAAGGAAAKGMKPADSVLALRCKAAVSNDIDEKVRKWLGSRSHPEVRYLEKGKLGRDSVFPPEGVYIFHPGTEWRMGRGRRQKGVGG